MYCNKCGKLNPDGAAFCDNCGNNLAEGAQQVAPSSEIPNNHTPVYDNSGDYNPPAKQDNKKKLIAIAACAVAAIVVIVLIVSNLGGGYKAPLKNMISGINKGDLDTFLKAFPEPMVEAMKEDDDAYDELKDDFDDYLIDALEDEYGEDLKASFEITDEDECSKSELEDYEDRLGDYYELLEDKFDMDLDKPEVTKGYELDVEMTIEGSEDDDTNETTFYVYKVDGKWTLSFTSMMF